jgi:hypothetical protein
VVILGAVADAMDEGRGRDEIVRVSTLIGSGRTSVFAAREHLADLIRIDRRYSGYTEADLVAFELAREELVR